MKLTVNGREQDVEVFSLDELIQHYQLKAEHVVVEVDGEIIDRSQWNTYALKPHSQIELIHFVGGG